MTLRDEAVAVADDLVELRHALHAEPEIGYDLPKTQRKVLDALDGLPLEISTGDKLTSVTAVLRGGRPGPVVLLRGDMDALPIHEATGVPFTSRIDGVMHACGHDLHTTMLAGAARLLSARQADLPGTVIFMFQPAEEGGGGAKMMIDEGVLGAAGARPVAAYALHVFSGLLDHGVFALRPGPILAGSDAIDVTVRGRGGHGSAPHRCADPIPAACEMVTALHTMVTRRFDVFDPVVVTVGSIHGGTARNVIPDEVTFLVTARSFSPDSKAKLRENMVRLLESIALAHGVNVEIDYADGYPVTANDAGKAAFAASTVADLFGADRAFDIPDPLTGSEDFSFVLQQVPGAFVLLGACPPGTDVNSAAGNHSALATFDDGVLVDGTTLYAELAVRTLAG
ncbi:MAG TPA: M20 family metallopeptidase [Streptosporangiaceae bacterium]|nr:M20 family metallopeptidase [Streptosporangiaceae bacterium]